MLRFGARTYLDTNLAQSDLIQSILSLTSNLWPSPLCMDLLLNLLISLFQVSNKSEGKADYLWFTTELEHINELRYLSDCLS